MYVLSILRILFFFACFPSVPRFSSFSLAMATYSQGPGLGLNRFLTEISRSFQFFFIGALCYSEFLLPYPYSLPRFSVKAFTSFLRIIKCRNVIVCLTQSSCFFRRFLRALNDKLILMWAISSPSFYLYTNIYIVYNNTAAPNPNPNPISQVQARRIRRRRIMLGRTLLRPPRLLRYSRRLSPM